MVHRQDEVQLDVAMSDAHLFDHRADPYPARPAVHTAGRSTVDALDADALRQLFATPPPEFVATRNALAKQLRKDDREAAASVAAMRRPAWTEWALNVTSAEHAEDVAAFAEAAEACVKPRPRRSRGATVPTCGRRCRRCAAPRSTLVGHANATLRAAGRPEETPELVGKLSELATSAAAIEQLRRAVLGSGDAGDSDVFAGLEPAPASARRARPAPGAHTEARNQAKTAAKQRAEPEAKVTAIEKRRRQRDLDVAERQFQKSRRRLREVEAEAASAGDAVAAAERTLALARGRLEKAQAQVEQAAAAMHDDEAARDAAAAALEDV